MARLSAKQQTGVVPPTWPLYTLPHMARLYMARLLKAARAIFGPPGIFKFSSSTSYSHSPLSSLPPLTLPPPHRLLLVLLLPFFLLYPPRFPSSSSSSSYSNTSSSPSSTFLLFFLVFPFLLLHRFLLFL